MDWMTREELMRLEGTRGYERFNHYPHGTLAGLVTVALTVGLLFTLAYCGRNENKKPNSLTVHDSSSGTSSVNSDANGVVPPNDMASRRAPNPGLRKDSAR